MYVWMDGIEAYTSLDLRRMEGRKEGVDGGVENESLNERGRRERVEKRMTKGDGHNMEVLNLARAQCRK